MKIKKLQLKMAEVFPESLFIFVNIRSILYHSDLVTVRHTDVVVKIPGPLDSTLTTVLLKLAHKWDHDVMLRNTSPGVTCAHVFPDWHKRRQITTNLSIKPQIFVVGRHLKNRCPYLCSFCYRGLVDGGGEKRHVVIDILGKRREI